MKKIKTNKSQFEMGATQTVNIQDMVENTIRRQFSISEESKQLYTEEITLEIPSKKKLKVIFNWKRIWQHGLLLLKFNGEQIEMPFQIVVGVTFDQSQVDIN